MKGFYDLTARAGVWRKREGPNRPYLPFGPRVGAALRPIRLVPVGCAVARVACALARLARRPVAGGAGGGLSRLPVTSAAVPVACRCR